MPLDSRDDYERINEHLAELDAPLESFALCHGYQLTPRLRAGLYPRIELRREATITLFIRISMQLDPDDRHYDHYFPGVPYTVEGIAWIDDPKTALRWRSPDIRIEAVPFCLLSKTLHSHLRSIHDYLVNFTEEDLRSCGRPLSPFPSSPPPPPESIGQNLGKLTESGFPPE